MENVLRFWRWDVAMAVLLSQFYGNLKMASN